MASLLTESCRQGVGWTPQERKADARARKEVTHLARPGEKVRSNAHGKGEGAARTREITCLYSRAGTPHHCSAPIERGGKRGEGKREEGGAIQPLPLLPLRRFESPSATLRLHSL